MAVYNAFTLYRGEDVTLSFDIVGSPDMSLWTIRFCLLTLQGDDPTSALLTKTVGSGVTVSGGTVTVLLSSTNLSITAAIYYYTLARTDSHGVLAYGPIDLRPPRAA